MAIESSDLSPAELERLRERLKADMDAYSARADIDLGWARDLRAKAGKHRWLVRWWFLTLAAGAERRGAIAVREVMRIRKALKNGDEAAYGGHRAARRLLHRQAVGRD